MCQRGLLILVVGLALLAAYLSQSLRQNARKQRVDMSQVCLRGTTGEEGDKEREEKAQKGRQRHLLLRLPVLWQEVAFASMWCGGCLATVRSKDCG